MFLLIFEVCSDVQCYLKDVFLAAEINTFQVENKFRLTHFPKKKNSIPFSHKSL